MSSFGSNPWWVELCGSVGPIAAVVVFLAPLPTMRKISRDRSVGSLPLLPYTSMVSSCFLWTTYGVLKHEYNIWACNGVGFVLGVFYVANFLPHAPKSSPTLPGSVMMHVQGCAFIILTTLLVAFFLPLTDSIRYVGLLGITLCLVLFASPLAALGTVLETRSAASIPLPFTLAMLVNCASWTVWGVFAMNDFAIYFPNGLGLVFGLLQLGLKIAFGSGTDEHGSEDDDDMQDSLIPS